MQVYKKQGSTILAQNWSVSGNEEHPLKAELNGGQQKQGFGFVIESLIRFKS